MNIVAPDLPETYLTVITPIVDAAVALLGEGAALPPFVFVGSTATFEIVPLPVEGDAHVARQRIQAEAARLQADLAFLVQETWALQLHNAPSLPKILQKYGSVGASPFKDRVLSLTLETRNGAWAGNAVLPKEEGANGRLQIPPTLTLNKAERAPGRLFPLLSET